jgi:hypothetical protein
MFISLGINWICAVYFDINWLCYGQILINLLVFLVILYFNRSLKYFTV